MNNNFISYVRKVHKTFKVKKNICLRYENYLKDPFQFKLLISLILEVNSLLCQVKNKMAKHTQLLSGPAPASQLVPLNTQQNIKGSKKSH